jgi:pimeloyl-ACP methyl ester carboxylesterase
MESCRRDLVQQGHAPPYCLLSLSLGSMMAVSWASRYPRECQALVLINTSLRPWSPFYARMRPSSWPIALRLLASSGYARERAILELTSARAAERSDLIPAWMAYAQECPVSRRNALRQLLAAARFSCRERPAVPLLLLAGGDDRLVHPRCSQTLARAWNADFALHPSAGHDLPLDDGDWVTQAVRRWLTG